MTTNSSIGRDIPEQLRREVLIEAGHRCAIPTCGQTTLEVAHIKPWEEVHEHTFDNLIALCPTDHTRYDQKHEIDRKAMLQYKANLSIINRQTKNTKVELITNKPNKEATLFSTNLLLTPLAARFGIKFSNFNCCLSA